MFRVVESVRTSETSVDNNFTRQYIPEDNSEHHTRRRENLKSHLRVELNVDGHRSGTAPSSAVVVCGVVLHKASDILRQLLIYCASPSQL
jgi:hypothetical protein